MKHDERLLLRVGEAADLLGVSRSQAYWLIREGRVPALRLGHSIRVPTAALRSWLQSEIDCEQKATEPSTR